jgi:hypothetical protein
VLVARAMPGALPKENKPDDAEILAESLKKMTVSVKSPTNKTAPIPTTTISKERRSLRAGDAISPTDFITLQSLRSSALARKTNTTSKFARDGANLFADLLATDEKEEKPVEQKSKPETDSQENDKKEDKAEKSEAKKDGKTTETKESENDENDEKSSELLARGPIKAARMPTTYQPYSSSGTSSRYGMMAPQALPQGPHDPMNYQNNGNYYYGSDYYPVTTPATMNPWLNYRNEHSNSSTPDTVHSDNGYGSSSSYSPQYQGGYVDQKIPREEMDRLLNVNKADNELPDAISDFILQYSRRYTDKQQQEAENGTTSRKSSTGSQSSHHLERPGSADSGCNSPLSAGSAPHSSPAHPSGGTSGPSTPTSDPRFQSRTDRTTTGRPTNSTRHAKERFRQMINEEQMDEAWVWTCRFIQEFPGAICYQDNDRDSLLHIVTHHMDCAKVFTLVEQMLKTEYACSYKPFDMPNRMNETPLFLAVERRRPEVVDYLLEVGANPNMQTSRPERDGPLHYAASRGMTEIVQVLCSYSTTNLNLVNGMGLTPLLCAVKNHGVLDEATQCIIDNKAVIQALLKYGADPHITDITNGKTVIHYAVERMDPEVIELFKFNLFEDTMTSLVNKPDLCNETPIQTLTSLRNLDENIRSALCLRLVTCGANMNTTSPSN